MCNSEEDVEDTFQQSTPCESSRLCWSASTRPVLMTRDATENVERFANAPTSAEANQPAFSHC